MTSYTLDIIDENRLLNKTLPHIATDTLYIRTQIKNGHRQFFASWVNGKKADKWIYFKNGKYDHYKLYKKGILIENGK